MKSTAIKVGGVYYGDDGLGRVVTAIEVIKGQLNVCYQREKTYPHGPVISMRLVGFAEWATKGNKSPVSRLGLISWLSAIMGGWNASPPASPGRMEVLEDDEAMARWFLEQHKRTVEKPLKAEIEKLKAKIEKLKAEIYDNSFEARTHREEDRLERLSNNCGR